MEGFQQGEIEREGILGGENDESKGLKLGKQSMYSCSQKYKDIQEHGILGKLRKADYRWILEAWIDFWEILGMPPNIVSVQDAEKL